MKRNATLLFLLITLLLSGLAGKAQTLAQAYKIVAGDRVATDNFGYSVATDGNYAIVGAYYQDYDASGANSVANAGAAYIFKRENGSWAFQQKLVAADRVAGDFFGSTVAITDGYAIVGAFLQDYDASGANSVANAGAAYIFKRENGSWAFQQKLVAADRVSTDYFGISVAITDGYAIVGAMQQDYDASGANSAANAGAAYIFKLTNGSWVQQQKLVAADRVAYDNFGQSVAITNGYAIVGATQQDFDTSGANSASSAGAAYIFKLNSGSWVQQQKLVAADRATYDYFGLGVAITDGYAIVGAYGQDYDASGANSLSSAGAAYIFKLDNGSWTQQQKLVAADRVGSDYFGYHVGITDGYAIVGAYGQDYDASGANSLSSAGAAYIFKLDNNSWTQQQKLVAADRVTSDNFGYGVAIAGGYAIVGAYGQDYDASGANSASAAGAAYIFADASTLPVTLISYIAKANRNYALLQWQTANEVNNKGFDVERSANGKIFSKIGFVAGAGTTSIPQQYLYTDQLPLSGVNYYRLKQIDADGGYAYSTVQTVTFPTSTGIKIYPNPAENVLNIVVGSKGVLTITDASGKTVKTVAASGTETLRVDVSAFGPGVYFFRIDGYSGSFVKE
ncbi:MAG: T9SS type A sorting domain-containing protein [Edaphocola sp.]